MATKGRSLAGFLSLQGGADSTDLILGDSNTNRLYLPGLGIDTDSASHNKILAWDSDLDKFVWSAGVGGGTVDSNAIFALIDSDYIRNRSINLLLDQQDEYILDRYRFVSDSAQTIFKDSDYYGNILSGLNSSSTAVYVNGLLLTLTEDYTVDSPGQLTFTQGLQLDDEVAIIDNNGYFAEWDSARIENVFDSGYVTSRVDSAYFVNALETVTYHFAAARTLRKYEYTATLNQTVFNGTDRNGATLDITSDNSHVYVDGALKTETVDYTVNSTNQITFSSGLSAGAEVIIHEFAGRYLFDATELFDSNWVNNKVSTEVTSAIGAITTDDVNEGNTNLYYTDARADSRIVSELTSLNGSIIPALDSTYDLGDSNHKFRHLYLSGSTIFINGNSISIKDEQLRLADSVGQKITLDANVDYTSLKNIDFNFSQAGDLEITTGERRWYAPKDLTLNNITGRVGTAPTDADVIIRINSTDVLADSTRETYLTISDGTLKATQAVNIPMLEDDYLTIDITQIGSTLPGKELNMTFTYS